MELSLPHSHGIFSSLFRATRSAWVVTLVHLFHRSLFCTTRPSRVDLKLEFCGSVCVVGRQAARNRLLRSNSPPPRRPRRGNTTQPLTRTYSHPSHPTRARIRSCENGSNSSRVRENETAEHEKVAAFNCLDLISIPSFSLECKCW